MKISSRSSSHCLQLLPSATTPLKRNLKICNPKLPDDFFGERSKNILGVSNTPLRPLVMKTQGQNRQYNLQQASNGRLQKLIRNQSNESKRSSYTTRQLCQTDNPQLKLMKEIINKNREIRRTFRKHSVELEKQQKTTRKDLMYFELPPLQLGKASKGITAPF